MKVLQISTELVHSGAEKIVYDLSCYLQEKDHEVVVACVKSVRGEVGEWLEEKGIRVFWVDLDYYHPFKFLLQIFKFIRFVRREKFDLIHAHQFHANVIGRLACFFNSRVKLISTVHLVDRRKVPWHFWFDRLTSFLCEKEICVSNAVMKFTAKKVPNMKSKLSVIYNGVDFDSIDESSKIDLHAEHGIEGDTVIFGSIGRLNSQKGFSNLLKAFSKFSESREKVHLLVIGEGHERSVLDGLIKDLGLEKKVSLLGYKKGIGSYLKSFDLMIMPSLYEGFGLVAVEALGLGVPIIASDVDSLPEIIQDGKTGYLFPAKDQDSLVKCMEVFWNHKGMMKDMAMLGKKDVRYRFAFSKMLEQYLASYHRLLN